MRYIQRLIKKWSKYFNNIYKLEKKAYSMLLNSKLLASFNTSKGSSKNKPFIYEKEMNEKKDSLLTKEEFEDEKLQDADEDE